MMSGLNGPQTVEITVLKYIRGEKANKMVENADMFNDKPKKGYEYLLVEVEIKYLKGSGKLSVTPDFDFEAVANGVGYDPDYLETMPKSTPALPDVDLLPGGEVKGWLLFMVPEHQKVLLGYEGGYLSNLTGYIEIPAS